MGRAGEGGWRKGHGGSGEQGREGPGRRCGRDKLPDKLPNTKNSGLAGKGQGWGNGGCVTVWAEVFL
jgi:hypothetical protein